MQRWRDILIDFVVDLPNSNRFTNIMVVINYLIKMRHIIPIVTVRADCQGTMYEVTVYD